MLRVFYVIRVLLEVHCMYISKRASKCKGVDVGLEYSFTVTQVN